LSGEARFRNAFDVKVVDGEKAAQDAIATERRQGRLRHRRHEEDVEVRGRRT
jgi:hypothetical protein